MTEGSAVNFRDYEYDLDEIQEIRQRPIAARIQVCKQLNSRDDKKLRLHRFMRDCTGLNEASIIINGRRLFLGSFMTVSTHVSPFAR